MDGPDSCLVQRKTPKWVHGKGSSVPCRDVRNQRGCLNLRDPSALQEHILLVKEVYGTSTNLHHPSWVLLGPHLRSCIGVIGPQCLGGVGGVKAHLVHHLL